jgi:hypothetical protein
VVLQTRLQLRNRESVVCISNDVCMYTGTEVMLKCHRKGEQKMVKTSKKKTQIQAHYKCNTGTHTHTQIETRDYVHGI